MTSRREVYALTESGDIWNPYGFQKAGSLVELQLVKWTAEGMVKGSVFRSEYSVTLCVRESQGVCMYSVEAYSFPVNPERVNQGGTAGTVNFSSLVFKTD